MKGFFKGTWAFGWTQIKRFFRDPTALFFTFLFPLLFLVVFGMLYKNNSSLAFRVAVLNHSDSAFSKQFIKEISEGKNSVLKVQKDVKTFEEAKKLMGRGQLDSAIELPANFGEANEKGLPSGELAVYYEQANPQSGQTLASVMQSILDKVNEKLTRQTDPFKVKQKPTSTANVSQFDYTFAGLIGFSLLSLGIFGLANGLPSDKKAGMLRRLRATPLTATQMVLGTMINYLAVGIISIILMFIVGLTVFEFNMRGDYFSLAVIVLLGLAAMLGFGLAIGGWAKNEVQSAPLTNLIAFPMMFLSGTFFPRYLMPEWLQDVTSFLPLTPIVDGVRYVTTEGKTLLELGPEIAIIGAWIVVVYLIAIRVFRWE